MSLRASFLVVCFALAGSLAAQEPAASPAPEEARDASRFKRRHASGRYVDAESRFSLQGYVTGTFADFQEDFLANNFPAPGQLLVPRTANSSFQYDWAMFLGSKLNDTLRFVVETHFVPRADGSFDPEVVTTEAQVTWLPFDDKNAARLSLGQFWSPFAGINDDWFSAVNQFATIPFAARAFPLHYNERGIAVEGEFDLGGNRGLNYALSLGNGVSGLGLDDQHAFDLDDDKTFTGRVGFFPAGASFELGLSAMSGTLRDVGQPERDPEDPAGYPASLVAFALDLRFNRPGVDLRAYGLRSVETLEDAGELERWGLMAEGSVRVARSLPVLREAWIKARYDRSKLDSLAGVREEDEVVSIGLNLKPARRTVLKVEGFFHAEKDGRRLRDDGFAVQMSASF